MCFDAPQRANADSSAVVTQPALGPSSGQVVVTSRE
jgi:hypothetical protein